MPVFPLAKSSLRVSMLSLNFDVMDVFWSSKVGKTIRAFIEMSSFSDLNVQLFISIVISSIKSLPVDPEGNKNSDFLQWTAVLYTPSNLLFITSLLTSQIFSSSSVLFGMENTVVDVVSIIFGLINFFSLQTRVCWFNPRAVSDNLLHLAHCSGDEFESF